MKKYTLVFAFDLINDKVCLIRKEKPEHMRGLLNGVGGKLEAIDNSFLDCAIREFHEETSVLLPKNNMINAGHISDDQHFFVQVFTINTNLIYDCITNEKEIIGIYAISDVLNNERFLVPETKNIIQSCLNLL